MGHLGLQDYNLDDLLLEGLSKEEIESLVAQIFTAFVADDFVYRFGENEKDILMTISEDDIESHISQAYEKADLDFSSELNKYSLDFKRNYLLEYYKGLAGTLGSEPVTGIISAIQSYDWENVLEQVKSLRRQIENHGNN